MQLSNNSWNPKELIFLLVLSRKRINQKCYSNVTTANKHTFKSKQQLWLKFCPCAQSVKTFIWMKYVKCFEASLTMFVIPYYAMQEDVMLKKQA